MPPQIVVKGRDPFCLSCAAVPSGPRTSPKNKSNRVCMLGMDCERPASASELHSGRVRARGSARRGRVLHTYIPKWPRNGRVCPQLIILFSSISRTTGSGSGQELFKFPWSSRVGSDQEVMKSAPVGSGNDPQETPHALIGPA